MSGFAPDAAIRVAIGPDADRLLADAGFVARWQALFAACPWATSAQAPGFVQAWRDSYRSVGDLFLAFGHAPDGTLAGVMALVRLGRSRRLTHAGLGQAEYHGWLCTAASARTFPRTALTAVAASLPGAVVRFGYLAPGTPVDWLDDGPYRTRVLATTHRRPTIDVAKEATVTEWRRNRRNREKLRQFERMTGPLTLRRITDADEYDAVLERIMSWCDIRQASMHGRAPFRSDPSKAPFYRALFRQPGLLHATALHVGDRLVAVNLGGLGRNEVQLGVIAHDPTLARHSPGTFLIRLLPELLHAEGHARLDLTAGGDAYKDRFATGTDELLSLEVHASGWSASMARATRAVRECVEARLAARGITRRQVKLAIMQLREARLSDVAAWFHAWRDRRLPAAVTLFSLPPGSRRDVPAVAPQIEWNDIDRLLAFDGTRPGLSRQAFLATALRRLESGQQICTWQEGGRPLGHAWLVPKLTEAIRVSAFPALPEACQGSALIHDCFVDPRARGRGIGAALFAAAIVRAGEESATVHAMAVRSTPRTEAWLARAGFEMTGTFAPPPAPRPDDAAAAAAPGGQAQRS